MFYDNDHNNTQNKRHSAFMNDTSCATTRASAEINNITNIH